MTQEGQQSEEKQMQSVLGSALGGSGGEIDRLVAQLEQLQALQREQLQELREQKQELREQKQELREQKQELQALRAQIYPISPHKPEKVARGSHPPVPPPIVNHLSQILGPAQWLLRPLGHWFFVKPLNYLVIAPLVYGWRHLDPRGRIGQFTAQIGQQPWEKRLYDFLSSLGQLGIVKLTAGVLLIVGYGVFVLEMGERSKQRQYQAWTVVNTGATVEPDYDYVFEDPQTGRVVYVGASIAEARDLLPDVAKRSQVKKDKAGQPMERVRRGSTGEAGRTQALQDLHRHQQSLAGLQAPGAYLPRVNLGGWCWGFVPHRFSWACLKTADLRGANLEGGVLGSANLEGANLSNAHLEGADLGSANLEGADLSDAHLEGVDLRYATLKGANLWGTILEDAVLGSANLEGADLSNANLKGVDLAFSNLEGADLGAANLEGAVLGYANLEGALVRDTNLRGAALRYTNLNNAYLWYVNLEGADLGYATLKGADLTYATVKGAALGASNLEDADVVLANLEGADVALANFQGALLLGANLRQAKNLTADQLVGSYLCDTDLPPALKLDADRDCEKLPAMLLERNPWLGTIEDAQKYINNIHQEKANDSEDQ